MRIPLHVTALLFAVSLLAAANAPAGARPAPRFHLPARTGYATLDSLAGQVVVVDFWASWCVPCHRSFPWLAGLAARYGAQGLKVVAINLDKSRDAAEAFLLKNPAPFVVAFDPAGQSAAAYHVTAMPSTFLVAADGTLLEEHRGFEPGEARLFETAIRKALGIAPEPRP